MFIIYDGSNMDTIFFMISFLLLKYNLVKLKVKDKNEFSG